MKKVLVLLLALAMLAPMCLVQPVNAEEAFTAKPFYTLAWSDFDQDTYQYLDGLYTLNWGSVGGNITLGGLMYDDNWEEDPSTMKAQALALAQTVKANLDKRPAGARYITTFGPAKMYRIAPENALFFDHAVDQMKVIMDFFFSAYKELGGQLDGLVIDLEYVGLSTYYLMDTDGGEYQPDSIINNPDILRNIVKDKRYYTEIRPLLEEWGFIFYQADTAEKQASYTELYSIHKNAGSKYDRSRSVWNTVMRIHLNNTLNEWGYEPLMKHFPEATMSDYQSMDSAMWLKMSAITDDGTEINGGNSVVAGNVSTYSYYYGQPNSDFYSALKKYTGYNDAIMAKEPFTQLMYYVNFTRYMYESSTSKMIAPWITYYDYGTETSYRISNTAYYTEQLYHLGMFDPQPFLNYTYVGDGVFKDGRENSTHYKEIQQVNNEIMAELTRVAGYSDRKPITSAINWNSDFILTGMYAGGRNIWRITPNTSQISLENFLMVDEESSTPTFFVNGQTVSFPGGKIIEDTAISILGSCGYWIETDADVTPVIMSNANRYKAYPSMEYDFNDYEVGPFDYNTSQPKNAWGFTWKKFGDIQGASNIVEVEGDKKVSIIGNSKNWVKELPVNITAGDTYAEDQTWELTVTIPEEMSADAQINILNYEGKNQEIEDAGFMIKGGKLYYATGEIDEEEELVYTEWMDITPGTYTFRREMNFHFMQETIYSNYILLDASGSELAKLENIPSPGFKYITTIGFGVEKADRAVIVDDFKIYLTGVTADFSVYDAKTGQDAEVGAERTRSTAYRLSWLNATNVAQTANIKVDITENGTTTTETLKTVRLLPGNDGIVTGIVEVKEGQTIKVYMETTIAAPKDPGKVDETDPTDNPDDPGNTDAPSNGRPAPMQPTSSGKKPTAIYVVNPNLTPATQATQAPTEEPTEAPTEEPTVAPTEEPTVAPTEEPTEAPTEETEEPEETKDKDKDKDKDDEDEEDGPNVIVIVAAAVVVLAGAGAGTYFFVIKKKKK